MRKQGGGGGPVSLGSTRLSAGSSSMNSSSRSTAMSGGTSLPNSTTRSGAASTASTVPYALHYEDTASSTTSLLTAKVQERAKTAKVGGVGFSSRPHDDIPRNDQRGGGWAVRRAATASPAGSDGSRYSSSKASTQLYGEEEYRRVERFEEESKGASKGGEKKVVGFGGAGDRGGEKVVILARELWEFDSKHRRLAKDLERYIHGGKVEDPVNLAAYIESKMGSLELEELRKRNKDKVRSEAELARRGKLEQERDLEEERVATKLGREVERQLSRCEDLFQLRDKLFKKEEETCARKRGEELSRRERDRGELVVKEEMRVAEFDESARAREVRRREAMSARQDHEFDEERGKDRAMRVAKVRREEQAKALQEERDPQVIVATTENPHKMPGHSRQIAPYAMQQRPMVARLQRWRHADNDDPDHTLSRPLGNVSYRQERAERKPLRPYDGHARAYDAGIYVSRKWVETRPW